jgi:hypothetical protein
MSATLEPDTALTISDGDDLMILLGEHLVGPQKDIENGCGDADVVLAEMFQLELLQIATESPDWFSYAVAELLNSAFKLSVITINEPPPKARRQIRDQLAMLRAFMRDLIATRASNVTPLRRQARP